MTRKRLNLFGKTKEKNLATAVNEKTVLYTTVGGVILFVAFLILSILNVIQKSTIQSALNDKQKYLNFLVENKNSETETTYFLLKKEQLKTFLKDDANFLPYYTILNNSLAQASNSAAVQSMKIDKSKKTEFTINFADYNQLHRFLKYVESDEFLRNFDALTMVSFSLNQTGPSSSKGYQVNFEGQFKTIAL